LSVLAAAIPGTPQTWASFPRAFKADKVGTVNGIIARGGGDEELVGSIGGISVDYDSDGRCKAVAARDACD